MKMKLSTPRHNFIAMLVVAAVTLLAAPRAQANLLGWAVGFGGTIVHTSDGGANWVGQASGTGNTLRGVDFVDALNGWVVGEGGVIVHTSDGGANWVGQSSGTGNDFFGVAFVIPEPTTVTLLGIGLAALVVACRRRKK